MAFGFFRRNQKIVLVIMVLLMVAFLIPSALQSCGQRGGQKRTIGYVKDDKITNGMIQSAKNQVDLLDRFLRGQDESGRAISLLMFDRFAAFHGGCDGALGLGWVLLGHEANEMGVRVTEAQVDALLRQFGLEGEAYRQRLVEIQKTGASEKQFRGAVAAYLRIAGAFSVSRTTTPPSLTELRREFQDLVERIELAMVLLPAAKFTEDAPDPTEEQIQQLFDEHREAMPNVWTNRTKFGFGYRLPDRAHVAYLLVARRAVERAADPPEDDMMEYWRLNRGKLMKVIKVPAPPPASRPAEPTTTTAPAPPKPAFVTREVPIASYSEAMPQIREQLRRQTAQAKTFELLRIAKGLIEGFTDEADPYAKAADYMVTTAEELLKRPIGKLPGDVLTAGEMVEVIEEAAGVKVIFPFGTHEAYTIDKMVKVKPVDSAEKLTLGAVLAKLAEDVKLPAVEWVTCRGFPNTIFPRKPVNLVPILAGQSGLISLEALATDEILGEARAGANPRESMLLTVIVNGVKEFEKPGAEATPLIATGKDFSQAMYVGGPRGGRLLWRLMDAKPSETPQTITEPIRKQIIADIKTMHGYDQALAAAEEMLAELRGAATRPASEQDEGDVLEKLAEARKLKVLQTGPFARKIVTLDMMTQAMSSRPSPVIGIGPDPAFLTEAFELVPADPAKPATDRPAAVVARPRQREVVLIQRTGYTPVTTSQFQDMRIPAQLQIRGMTYQQVPIPLLEVLRQRRMLRDLMTWFVLRGTQQGQTIGIESRTGFTRKSQ